MHSAMQFIVSFDIKSFSRTPLQYTSELYGGRGRAVWCSHQERATLL